MFGCCPRHHVRTLVPERGDPTTKIGLFILRCIRLSCLYSLALFQTFPLEGEELSSSHSL
jgi:hypothetical protein